MLLSAKWNCKRPAKGVHKKTASRAVFSMLRVQIDSFAQLLARLEVRNLFTRHLHLLAGFWIAPDTRCASRQRKAAEPADLDALTFGESLGHCIKNGLDGKIGIAGGQLRIAGRQRSDQFRLRHRD